MSNYFEDFPRIQYPYRGKLTDKTLAGSTRVEVVDLMVRYRVKESILKNPLACYDYLMKDNERPDQVAANYYGDPSYAWLVMLSGQLFDWQGDLPVPYGILQEVLQKKYSMTAEQINNTIYEYRDKDGHVIDFDTYSANLSTSKAVSIYDYEDELNEKKRKIKLLSRIYLDDVNREFSEELRALFESRSNNLSGATL